MPSRPNSSTSQLTRSQSRHAALLMEAPENTRWVTGRKVWATCRRSAGRAVHQSLCRLTRSDKGHRGGGNKVTAVAPCVRTLTSIRSVLDTGAVVLTAISDIKLIWFVQDVQQIYLSIFWSSWHQQERFRGTIVGYLNLHVFSLSYLLIYFCIYIKYFVSSNVKAPPESLFCLILFRPNKYN